MPPSIHPPNLPLSLLSPMESTLSNEPTSSANDLDSLMSLLSRARDGDVESRNHLLQMIRWHIANQASADFPRVLSSKMDASDIVQQSLVEADRGLQDFCGTSAGELRVWLDRLVQRNLIDAKRHFCETRKRNLGQEVPLANTSGASLAHDISVTASAIVQRREVDEELESAIAQLPERRRRVVELRHRYRLSYADIAAQMGMSETAARKLWSRSLDDLRSLLKQPRDH